MKRPRIKICGITRLKDARLVSNLGADYIGVNFHGASPRSITIQQAKKIRETLDPVIQIVAVFVTERSDRIISICRGLQSSMVQLHGAQNDQFVRSLQKEGLKVARAYHVTRKSDWKYVRNTIADFALLDNQTTLLAGGTGSAFDWSLAPKKPVSNLILAGGLTASNFQQGVKVFAPAILDFNSGVEDAPGKKSERKLRLLFRRYSKLYGKTR